MLLEYLLWWWFLELYFDFQIPISNSWEGWGLPPLSVGIPLSVLSRWSSMLCPSWNCYQAWAACSGGHGAWLRHLIGLPSWWLAGVLEIYLGRFYGFLPNIYSHSGGILSFKYSFCSYSFLPWFYTAHNLLYDSVTSSVGECYSSFGAALVPGFPQLWLWWIGIFQSLGHLLP